MQIFANLSRTVCRGYDLSVVRSNDEIVASWLCDYRKHSSNFIRINDIALTDMHARATHCINMPRSCDIPLLCLQKPPIGYHFLTTLSRKPSRLHHVWTESRPCQFVAACLDVVPIIDGVCKEGWEVGTRAIESISEGWAPKGQSSCLLVAGVFAITLARLYLRSCECFTWWTTI